MPQRERCWFSSSSTLIVDVNDLVGVTDRKTRLAMRIGDDPWMECRHGRDTRRRR